jgi:protein-disulfide isomerase
MRFPARLTVPVDPRERALGPAGAPVTLVEYGDYECPICGEAYPVVKRALEEAGDRVRFVFRNFPLRQTHPHAMLAARAAEAAGTLGKYWQMHDVLYERQTALERNDLLAYAAGLGLDMEAFEAAMDDKRLIRKIDDDFRGGVRSGVNGTPSFYVNDVKLEGDWRVLPKRLTEVLAGAPSSAFR